MRQTDGTLRHANPVERDLTLQVYYPAEGKMYRMPTLFEEPERLQVRDISEHHLLLARWDFCMWQLANIQGTLLKAQLLIWLK